MIGNFPENQEKATLGRSALIHFEANIVWGVKKKKLAMKVTQKDGLGVQNIIYKRLFSMPKSCIQDVVKYQYYSPN